MTQQPFFTTLKGRGTLKISGIERKDFLQALITNDIEKLTPETCLYSCLLSPQGKFMFDFFIHEQDEALIMDCEGGSRLKDLAQMLNMYKLRRDVNITINDNTDLYAIFGTDKYGYKDPRHPDMGYRSFEKPKDIIEGNWQDWDLTRISLTVPDGSRDMEPKKSTMDEARLDQLNAVSYEKGCYIGQELTARMHYRGLGKKHLYTVTPATFGMKTFPKAGEAIEFENKNIGEMRSSCNEVGIALLKDNIAEKLL